MPEVHPDSPGWYPNPDPKGGNTLRWWNGAQYEGLPRPAREIPGNSSSPISSGGLFGAYVAGIAIPVVGWTLAIWFGVAERFAAIRRHALGIGLSATLAAVVYVVVIVWVAQSNAAHVPCIVTSSGATVCGSSAAAWCEATDSIRQAVGDPSGIQPTCDQLEARY